MTISSDYDILWLRPEADTILLTATGTDPVVSVVRKETETGDYKTTSKPPLELVIDLGFSKDLLRIAHATCASTSIEAKNSDEPSHFLVDILHGIKS